MDVRRISGSEVIAAVGGLLLAIGVFLPWYKPNPDNRNANVDGMRESVSAFDVHTIMRWLLLAAAAAPIILLWIVVRDHKLSWPRGEMTAVVGILAFGLTMYVGVIDRPGEPPSEISLGFGWFISLLGTIMIALGGSIRASTTERPRKPPGVL
jgi:archaellum biogenesis protein FlaJ (TadC family)